MGVYLGVCMVQGQGLRDTSGLRVEGLTHLTSFGVGVQGPSII